MHQHPDTDRQAEAHQQHREEGNATQTGDRLFMHLSGIRNIIQLLLSANQQHSGHEQPAQQSRQHERHSRSIRQFQSINISPSLNQYVENIIQNSNSFRFLKYIITTCIRPQAKTSITNSSDKSHPSRTPHRFKPINSVIISRTTNKT